MEIFFVQEMFLVIKHLLRSTPGHGIEAFKKWDDDTVNLNNQLQDCKYKVHVAFCGKKGEISLWLMRR